MGDEPGGDGEDVAARAVIALEPDHLGARKILLEAQDVVDVGAAPSVDRLIVVADAAKIAVGPREKPQPQILDDVGVLVFVDQDVAEAALEVGENVALLAKEPQRFEQEIAEVDGVQRLEPALVERVEGGAAAAGEARRFACGDVLGIEPAILPAVDQARQRARRPALVVEILRLQDLLQEPQLIVGVEDGEVRPQSDQFGMHAQDLDPDRMERAEPGHALRGAGEHGDALAHLARGLVGEGDGENFVRAGASGRDQMRDARRQHAGLADPRAGQHQHGTVEGLDGAPLLVVEPARDSGGRPRAADRAEFARRPGWRVGPSRSDLSDRCDTGRIMRPQPGRRNRLCRPFSATSRAVNYKPDAVSRRDARRDAPGSANEATTWSILRDTMLRIAPLFVRIMSAPASTTLAICCKSLPKAPFRRSLDCKKLQNVAIPDRETRLINALQADAAKKTQLPSRGSILLQARPVWMRPWSWLPGLLGSPWELRKKLRGPLTLRFVLGGV